jgi:membrane-bound ClpP family serine protease
MKRTALAIFLFIAACCSIYSQDKLPKLEDALKNFAAEKPKVLTVTISGTLTDKKVQKLTDAFDYGESKTVIAAVVSLDSSGGDIKASQDLATAIEGFKKPVTVYVRKDALDAAALLCFAADEVIVNDDAQVGGSKGVVKKADDPDGKLLSGGKSDRIAQWSQSRRGRGHDQPGHGPPQRRRTGFAKGQTSET